MTTYSSSASSVVFEQNENEVEDVDYCLFDDGQNGPKRGGQMSLNDNYHQQQINLELRINQKAMQQKIEELEKKLLEHRKDVELDQEHRRTMVMQLMQSHFPFMEKVGKIEGQTKANSDLVNALQRKITELEEQMEKQKIKEQNEDEEQLSEVDSADSIIGDEKFIFFRNQNWDANYCHSDLKILGRKCLLGHCHERMGWRSVFAEIPPLFDCFDKGFYYFEVKVVHMANTNHAPIVGVAAISEPFDSVRHRPSTIAFEGDGFFWDNGEMKRTKTKYGSGDVVGCRVDKYTKQVTYTKNGQRILGAPKLLAMPISPSLASLRPFVSLFNSGDLIEANFGPTFKYVVINKYLE